jgi:hypothetical protein
MEPSPARRRGWWQFSLLSLLLLVVIACLVAGYVGQMRRMEEARRELALRDETITRLRRELGIDEDAQSALSVSDPTKLHVAALPSFEEHTWRWKVYLPPGKTWQLGIEFFESDGGGKPLHKVSSDRGEVLGGGELVLEARLQRDLQEGKPVLQSRIGRSRSALSSTFLDAQVNAKGSVSVDQAGSPKQAVAEPGQRLRILWRTVMEEPKPVPGKNITIAHQVGAIAIFLEEAPPPAPAKGSRRASR